MGINIEGLDKLINGLANLDVNAAVKKGLKKTGRNIQEAAKMRGPVPVTGQLENSIYVKDVPEGVEVGASAKYAVYVEYGTGQRGEAAQIGEALDGSSLSYTLIKENSEGEYYDYMGQDPQPFLYPAVKDNEKNIAKNIADELEKALKEAIDA